MNDTSAASHITDHAFTPRGAWWTMCALCGIAEAAHARTTVDRSDPDNPIVEDAGDEAGRIYARLDDGVGAVGSPPAHYATQAGLDPFQVIDAFGLDYYEGNALKYLLRWRKKNGIADLRKAQHYIDELIQRSSSEDSFDPSDSQSGARPPR